MNILEGLVNAVKEPKPAPHVGEAFAIWSYYTALVHARTMCLVVSNHTADQELHDLIEKFMKEVEEPQTKQLHELMKREEIDVPMGMPDYPTVRAEQVPAGAKFSDDHITLLLGMKLEGLLTLCQHAMLISLRDDLGLMFYKFQGQLISQGFTLKQVQQKRGWLLVPPRYVKGGQGNHASQ